MCTPAGHADKPALLNNLGNAFFRRFERLGELIDIENAISFKQQAAVDLTPDGHADKAGWLNNLGSAFQSRFERLNDPEDISKATASYQRATKNTSSPPLTRYNAARRWAILSSEHQLSRAANATTDAQRHDLPRHIWGQRS
ncbi:hypothetical protein K435DRAFT_702716 [Dendrothele bispora CBS 962.96]|uniref:Uncharacterized protein n=1 Tax=Dendrothele bispora (strain CBS 962.96) TaxID=1314807 RepID=A0A4S8KPR4_DENBC|nr:hypothetical protein K435DRAFT_702716 [Dendrothele bispora CBS 962.96]